MLIFNYANSDLKPIINTGVVSINDLRLIYEGKQRCVRGCFLRRSENADNLRPSIKLPSIKILFQFFKNEIAVFDSVLIFNTNFTQTEAILNIFVFDYKLKFAIMFYFGCVSLLVL